MIITTAGRLLDARGGEMARGGAPARPAAAAARFRFFRRIPPRLGESFHPAAGLPPAQPARKWGTGDRFYLNR